MELTLKRLSKPYSSYTIGRLFDDKGKWICDTLEDPDRLLGREGGQGKVYSDTAIPEGRYKISLSVSPSFRYKSWAAPYGGKVPRLMNVPYFEGILIHPGNTKYHTSGCILVGLNTVKGRLTDSVPTFHKVMKILLEDNTNYITIKSNV